jgi:hypothetical protein
MPTNVLTYGDKKTLLAAAIGIREWRLPDDGLSDTTVVYESEDDTGFRGMFQRTYSIAEGNKVTLGPPVQVFKRTNYEPLVVVSTFSLDEAVVEFSDSDQTVIRTGKIFEAGDYGDKGNYSEQDLQNAASNFSAVPNNIEHKPSFLDGKLGKLLSVEAKGKELFGKVAIPKWLNDTLGSEPLKVSLEWLKSSKQIVGNALTFNPHIKDAQLVAAFSAANQTTEGGITMPEPKKTVWERLKAHFGDKGVPEDLKDLETAKFVDSEPAPAPAVATPAVVAPVIPAAPSTEVAQFKQDLDTTKAENAALRAKLLRDEAVKFADKAVADCKAMPAEKDSLVAMFVQAANDDSASGVACFSNVGQFTAGERVKNLQSWMDSKPAIHNLTTEQLVAFSADTATTNTNPERMNNLRQMSNLPTKEGK